MKLDNYEIVQCLLRKLNNFCLHYSDTIDFSLINKFASIKIVTGNFYFNRNLYPNFKLRNEAIYYYEEALTYLKKEVINHYMINTEKLIAKSVSVKFKKCIIKILLTFFNLSFAYEFQ